mmetsp:Transcript_95182/g.246441  ORF Transcript_95182/g.246441 Transcript_95182/m.246441 type:complete len:337 (+) Transcript_95182:831-1841(+)
MDKASPIHSTAALLHDDLIDLAVALITPPFHFVLAQGLLHALPLEHLTARCLLRRRLRQTLNIPPPFSLPPPLLTPPLFHLLTVFAHALQLHLHLCDIRLQHTDGHLQILNLRDQVLLLALLLLHIQLVHVELVHAEALVLDLVRLLLGQLRNHTVNGLLRGANLILGHLPLVSSTTHHLGLRFRGGGLDLLLPGLLHVELNWEADELQVLFHQVPEISFLFLLLIAGHLVVALRLPWSQPTLRCHLRHSHRRHHHRALPSPPPRSPDTSATTTMPPPPTTTTTMAMLILCPRRREPPGVLAARGGVTHKRLLWLGAALAACESSAVQRYYGDARG